MTRNNLELSVRTRSFTSHLTKLGIFLIALAAICECQRRPVQTGSVSPSVMDAYRQRWAEFLRLRVTAAPRPTRAPTRISNHKQNHNKLTYSSINSNSGNGNNGMVINGFQCERTYSFFPNKTNRRMYHLCARSRDQWYIYHYFCPQGATFNDNMKKCMFDRTQNSNPSTTSRPPSIRNRTRRPAISSARPSIRTTTPAPTTTIAAVTPESAATEMILSSSEELSTEEEMGVKNVVVAIPGFSSQGSSEEVEQVTKEHDEVSDESNMIPESANEPSGLFSSSETQVQKKEGDKKKSPSSPPPKVNKNTVGTVALGGRRPRILKKWPGYAHQTVTDANTNLL